MWSRIASALARTSIVVAVASSWQTAPPAQMGSDATHASAFSVEDVRYHLTVDARRIAAVSFTISGRDVTGPAIAIHASIANASTWRCDRRRLIPVGAATQVECIFDGDLPQPSVSSPLRVTLRWI